MSNPPTIEDVIAALVSQFGEPNVRNTARAVLTHTAAGAIPEAAIQDLLQAVEGLDLLQLARDLRGAEGRLRPRVALSLALEVLSVVRPSVVGADSADSADSEATK